MQNQRDDLDKYVDLYCRCPDIIHNRVKETGLFTYYLMGKKVFSSDINGNFRKCNELIVNSIEKRLKKLEIERFEEKLKDEQNKRIRITIDEVDLMAGHEFEDFVGLLFVKMRYDVQGTKGSGDQGLDVIAEKGGRRIGIQAKCYSGKVPNKSVQEITAALKHYKCDKGMVITN